MAIDWDRARRDLTEVLINELGDMEATQHSIEQLSRSLARYWRLAQEGSEQAGREAAHIQATIGLMGARLDVRRHERLEAVMRTLMNVGVAIGKAVV